MKIKAVMFSVLFAMFMVSGVQASEVDTFNVSGSYGQTGYATSSEGWSSVTVSVDGSGVDRTAILMHVSYSYLTGAYNYWRGAIPAEYVVSTGMDGISVNINTCDVDFRAGCGQVAVSVRADVPASGWIDNGVTQSNYGDFIYRVVGSRTTRFASSEGTVNGVPANSSRAFMVKGTDVTVDVTVGQ